MNLYWVYDIPNWLFATLVIGSFSIIAITGQRFTHRWVRRVAGTDGEYNDLVNTTLATVGVFFGITLGLISVGAWESFTAISDNVNQEVAAINVVYRAVSLYPEPASTDLKYDLKAYVNTVIQAEWPNQRHGIIPKAATPKLIVFQKKLIAFEPVTESMKALHSVTMDALNNIIAHRRSRLQSVTSGLPDTLWFVVIIGSLLNIFVPWFLVYKRQFIQDLMILLMAATIGLLVFLMGAMDNPFRGEFSISSEAFELIYQRMNSG